MKAEITLNPEVLHSLADYQVYVEDLKKARGFRDNPDRTLILVLKEAGMLGDAVRKTWTNDGKVQKLAQKEIRNQFADLFIYLVDFANLYGIDITEAFIEREADNAKRVWEPYHKA